MIFLHRKLVQDIHRDLGKYNVPSNLQNLYPYNPLSLWMYYLIQPCQEVQGWEKEESNDLH